MGRVSAAKIACIALTACLLACGVPSYGGSALAPAPAEAASAPAYNARLTQKNMLRLVRAYDSDAYRILRAQDRAGDSFATWMQGSERLVDAVDTTVHEEFHSFTHTYGGYVVRNGSIRLQDLYYLGGKKTRKVTTTAVFKSYLATRKIPKRYRTFRYKTYVSKSSDASANQYGVYGMLNEFSAYYWGMHASESMYPYIKKHASTADDYFDFASDFLNSRDAYAEFSYWTYVYLDYARRNNPGVYHEILGNTAYAKTFKTMRSKFKKLMKEYEGDLDKVCKKYNGGAGFSRSYDKKHGVLRIGNEGAGASGAYETLAGQLKARKYAKVRKALAKAAG